MNYIEDDLYSQTCPGNKYSYFASHETVNKGLPLSSLHRPGPSLNLASPQDIPLEQYCISGYSALWSKREKYSALHINGPVDKWTFLIKWAILAQNPEQNIYFHVH